MPQPQMTRITVYFDDGAAIDVDLARFNMLFWTEEALEMLRPFYEQQGMNFDRESAKCRDGWPCCHDGTCPLERLRPGGG